MAQAGRLARLTNMGLDGRMIARGEWRGRGGSAIFLGFGNSRHSVFFLRLLVLFFGGGRFSRPLRAITSSKYLQNVGGAYNDL